MTTPFPFFRKERPAEFAVRAEDLEVNAVEEFYDLPGDEE